MKNHTSKTLSLLFTLTIILSTLIPSALAQVEGDQHGPATSSELAAPSNPAPPDVFSDGRARRAAVWNGRLSPNAVLLSESFDDDPTTRGWQLINNVGTASWRFDDPGRRANQTSGTGNFAVADSDFAGQVDMDTELRTPQLDLSAHTNVKLKFKTFFQSFENSTADIDVSTDGGNNWTNVWRATGANSSGAFTVDLTAIAAGQANVLLRFRYYNAFFSWYWQVDDVMVETVSAPNGPTGLSATANQYDITLNWSDNSANETVFKIERSPDGVGNWTQVASVQANATSYTDQNLTCNTTFHYRVRATAGSLDSGYSNVPNATTAACVATTTVDEIFTNDPAARGWTVVNNVGGAGWRFDDPAGRGNNTGGAGGFAIADSDQAGQVQMDTELRTPVLNFAGQNAVSLTFNTYFQEFQQSTADVDVSLDAGATWSNVWRRTSTFQGPVEVDLSARAANRSSVIVRFRYYNAFFAWQWQIDNVALGALALPPAPLTLQAILSGNNQVNLSWVGGGAPGFRVERSLTGTGGWNEIANITNGATTYVDGNVAGNTQYFYRVLAYNGSGTSGYSNTASVSAGDNSVTLHDMIVSYYRTPTAAQRTAIEDNLRFFADGVYEASNGVNKVRQVTIYTNGANADIADIVWVQSCWPNAYISGRDRARGPDKRIEHCDSAFQGQENFLQQTLQGGYTLAHEFGHYFYSMPDEYRGNDPCGGDIGSPCASDTAVDGSIMSNQWIAAQGDFRGLNFSSALNNNPTIGNNAQLRIYGASAWETVARPLTQDPRDGARANRPARIYHPELAAVAPAPGQPPSTQLPGGQAAARSELTFNWATGPGGNALDEPAGTDQMVDVETGVVRQVLIDNSAGMAASGKLDQVKAAIKQWIAEARAGQILGIVHFDNLVTVAQPLTLLTEANRAALIAAVDAIPDGGSGAAIGDGLQTALDGLTSSAAISYTNRVVYLVTAGDDVVGTYPLSLLPAYQANYVPIYSFGVAAQPGPETTLRQLADGTGGEHFAVGNLAELQQSLAYADQATSPTIDVNVDTDWFDLDTGDATSIPVEVDSSLDVLEFEFVYDTGPSALTVTLVDPVSNPTVLVPASDCESWGGGKDILTSCFYSFSDAKPGTWTIELDAAQDVSLSYWVGGISKPGETTFSAIIQSLTGEEVIYPEPILLSAAVGKEFTITGGGVTAVIEGPDGNWEYISLRDDGIAPDTVAHDGLYGGLADYWMDGEYYILAWFDNGNGSAQFTNLGPHFSPHPSGNSPAHELTPVGEDFQRFAETQVSVSGVQEDDHTDWYDDPMWPATVLPTDNTPVFGRIDFADDVDVFQVTVPNDQTEPLGLRVDNLALDMDPYLYIYAEDWSWEFDAYLEFEPTSGDFLFVPLPVQPGETFYVEVWHFDPGAETGVYDISVGPYLPSDPSAKTAPPKKPTRVYLPMVVNNQ